MHMHMHMHMHMYAHTVQVLHFQKTQPKLMAAIYQQSRGERDFPFMTVSITMTQLSLQALRSGALTRLANRSEQVYETTHSFHHACYLYMHQAWQQRSLSIIDFGFLKKELQQLIHRKPARLMRALRAHGAPLSAAQGGGKSGSFVEFG